jgi:bifunctional DNA-binding transcriptional regulator/antitoxin component of YhaV-PrlF toxin-antitoxin module
MDTNSSSLEIILGVTSVYGSGRTQIPSRARKFLQVEDGDLLVWCLDQETDMVYVKKQPIQKR